MTAASGEEQILGIPSLQSGIGDLMNKALNDHLIRWDVQELVRAMCFDTISSNTGSKTGACAGLGNLLGRKLLNLACRHHVFELVLEAAFSLCFEPSSDPKPPIFKRFKDSWCNLDKSNFKSGITDPEVAKSIENLGDEINAFASEMLRVSQPRDDYKELLELVLIFTGYMKNPTFKIPGAMHCARWMAKAIYVLKIYLFRDEFPLVVSEKNISIKYPDLISG